MLENAAFHQVASSDSTCPYVEVTCPQINEFNNLTDGEMNKFIIPSGAFSSDMFKSSLTVLNLGNVVIDASALEDITSLIQLKYVSIFGNFSDIPPAISNLTNLETLVARSKSGILTLPGSILYMINLKHVDTSEAMIQYFNSVEAEKRTFSSLEKLESFSRVVILNGDDVSDICNKAPNLVQLELIVEQCVTTLENAKEIVRR